MEHPIHKLLDISLENIKEMIDVNTIIGTAIKGDNNQIIIPVSKVKFGFASGGTDIKTSNRQAEQKNPFGGGTGGSVSITPTAFLVMKEQTVEVLSLNNETHLYEKIIDKVPASIEKVKSIIKKENKQEENTY